MWRCASERHLTSSLLRMASDFLDELWVREAGYASVPDTLPAFLPFAAFPTLVLVHGTSLEDLPMKEDSQDQWTIVDDYLTELLIPSDPVLEAALADSEAAGLPAISVTPTQGKLLWLFARLAGASKILELGTLGGYSTIWLARALPKDGRLITIEASAEHAEVATANLKRSGLIDRVELRIGRGLDLLPQLATEGVAPFDLIFIDADKVSTADYFAWALKLARPGTLIITDNVIRKGAVADAKSRDPNIVGMRRFFELLAKEKGVSATAVQTVGSKGYDGFAIAIVNG